jgi:small GTP-binding protein
VLIFHKLTLSDDVFKYKNYFYLLKKIFYSILYGGEYMSKPIVAVVGRPNVGKSTLFNDLAGQQISIVKDTPGVTRDRIYADVTWLDKSFTLIDTGGIEPDTSDIILAQMREQAEIAIETADVIIFLTDVKQGLVDSDAKVADMLRRSRKPVILAVNKVDNFDKLMPDVYEFYNLGIGEPFPISAVNKLGFGEVLDEVVIHILYQQLPSLDLVICLMLLSAIFQRIQQRKRRMNVLRLL